MNRLIALATTTFLIAAALPVVANAYRYQPQEQLATWTTAADASTDCTASNTDYSPVTTATASLTCLNTGDLDVRGFQQVTVQIDFARTAGTAVVMQCDIANDGGTKWTPIMKESTAGEKSVWTPTETTSVNARITHNFDVNAWLLRCRFMVTGGGASDTIAYSVRVASIVEGN